MSTLHILPPLPLDTVTCVCIKSSLVATFRSCSVLIVVVLVLLVVVVVVLIIPVVGVVVVVVVLFLLVVLVFDFVLSFFFPLHSTPLQKQQCRAMDCHPAIHFLLAIHFLHLNPPWYLPRTTPEPRVEK